MIFYLLLNKPLKAKLNTTDNIERYCKKNRLSTFSKKIIKNVALNGGVDELLFLGVKLKKKEILKKNMFSLFVIPFNWHAGITKSVIYAKGKVLHLVFFRFTY